MRRPSLRIPRRTVARRVRPATVLLWSAQVVLAALFLFAGGMKLVLPIATFAAQSPLPGSFIRFIGILEVLGALGMVLPGLLRLRAELAVLAAAGLVLVMCGAVGATLADPHTSANPSSAIVPVLVGTIAAIVAVVRARQLGFTRAAVSTPTTAPARATVTQAA